MPNDKVDRHLEEIGYVDDTVSISVNYQVKYMAAYLHAFINK